MHLYQRILNSAEGVGNFVNSSWEQGRNEGGGPDRWWCYRDLEIFFTYQRVGLMKLLWRSWRITAPYESFYMAVLISSSWSELTSSLQSCTLNVNSDWQSELRAANTKACRGPVCLQDPPPNIPQVYGPHSAAVTMVQSGHLFLSHTDQVVTI